MQNPTPHNNDWLPTTHTYHFYVKAFYSQLVNDTGVTAIEPNRVYATTSIPHEHFLMLTSFLDDPHQLDNCLIQTKNAFKG